MPSHTPLAIIGYAYRAPSVGRKGLFEFLEQGKSAWSKVPSDRFNQDAYYHPSADKPGFISSQGAHFLPEDIYAFDPAFFNIKAEEARFMDPQHRLLLECAYEAAENSGLTLQDLMGANIGVFAAGDNSEYYNSEAQDLATSSIYTATGENHCFFSNRLSYFFGLTGPSVTVEVACASSSYAIHLACQSVLSGECSAAFVGGAKILNGPNQWIGLNSMGSLSPEGKCFSYDAQASGYGRGEGVACIIIKRLSDAVACGDPVRSLIINSASNHSGRTQGISVPGRASQEKLLLTLHQEIGLDPGDTPFVEGHGTGTLVGDPIEAGSISTVIAKNRSPSNPLYIGSVKSNIGHLESASGLISVIKCVMMLERQVMLPNANFTKFNPQIEGRERLKVLTRAEPWPQGAPKRICINNSGFGGSNAGLLLEAAPKQSSQKGSTNGFTDSPSNGGGSGTIANNNGANRSLAAMSGHANGNSDAHLFVFSAKSQSSLEAYLASFIEYLNTPPYFTRSLKDVAFTLGERRTQFSRRFAVSADSFTSLGDKLQSTPVIAKSGVLSEPILGFTFTGQGAQYYQMATGLCQYREFEQALLDADKHLLRLGANWSLMEELAKNEDESRINDARISQPACTAIQLALVVLLRSWGIIPKATLGHSSGEIAAAFAAGLVTFDSAIAIAYFRGIAACSVLENATVQGAMVGVGTSPSEAEKLFPDEAIGYAVIAAVNSHDSVTISGDLSAIEYIEELAREKGLFARRLKVNVAYHSGHMESVSDTYLKSILSFCKPGIISSEEQLKTPIFISSVTGRVESADTVDAHYWVKNLLHPVLYQTAVETLFSEFGKLMDDSNVRKLLIEIGPHAALQNPSKKTLERCAQEATQKMTYLSSLVRGKDSVMSLMSLAGNLFTMGLGVNLSLINSAQHSKPRVVCDMPSYEWNKLTRYLHQPRVAMQKLYGGEAYNKLLGWKSPYSEGKEQAFRNVFTLDDLPWIRDHVVNGDILFPFTGFVSLAIEGFRSLNSELLGGMLIRELHVAASLRIEEDQHVDITTKFRPAEAGTQTQSANTWAFEVLSWSELDGWTRHSYGFIEADGSPEPFSRSLAVQSAQKMLNNQTLHHRSAQAEYARLRDTNGVAYGPAFRNTIDFWKGPQVVVHTMAQRSLDFEYDAHGSSRGSLATVDPATIHTFFHSLGVIQDNTCPTPILAPTFALQWRMSNSVPTETGRRFSIVSRRLSFDEKSGNIEMDFVAFDISGDFPKPVAEIGPIKFQRVSLPDEKGLRLPHGYSIRYVPYVDLMDASILKDAAGEPKEGDISHLHDLDQVAIHFMSLALQLEYDMLDLPPYMTKFLGWAKRTLVNNPSTNNTGIQVLLDRVAVSNATGELVCSVGRQLPSILRGEKQPLEVMLEDGLLWRTYAEHVACIRANLGMAAYVGRLAACNADIKILELGAGTASATLPVLEAIDRATSGMEPHFTLTFTDISAGFFDKARTKLAKWSDRITYSKLDISQDPLTQGFSPGSFDVVMASNVLHATSDIVPTLKNVRTMLRPGGKLVLVEGVQDPSPFFFPYAMLEGWWLFEDSYRTDGPLITRDLWNAALEANGFSGLEGYMDDYPEQPEHLYSAMWSSRRDEDTTTISQAPDSITIYQCFPKEGPIDFSEVVAETLKLQLGGRAAVRSLQAHRMDDTCSPCIVLEGQRRSILSEMSSEMFYLLKNLFMKCPIVIWVLPNKAHPDATMIRGVLRTLRLEMPSSKLALLESPIDKCGAEGIARLAQHILQDPFSKVATEQEYSLIGNTLHVPRLQILEATRDIFAIEAGMLRKQEQRIWQEHTALELTVDSSVARSPDAVYFQQSQILSTDLGGDEILVRVEAAGINFIDLLLVVGSLPWSPPGLEGAGVVTRVGSQVKDLNVGDPVFYAVDKAGMANFVRMPSLCAQKIPMGLNMADAASMPIAYCTAVLSLIDTAHLRKGEAVLIHSASGAVGQACVMIAQHIEARIFATAGTEEKRAFLAQTFGIPKSQIFSSRTPDFKSGILEATNDDGVDVIVNCLSGELLRETWDCIAEGGRFVEIGKKDFIENSYLPMRHFLKNVTFSGVDLRRIITTRPAAVRDLLSSIINLVRCGSITPIRTITNIAASQVSVGLRMLQAGQNIGKIVVKMRGDEDVVAERLLPSKRGPKATQLLRADATYVIAGGTGGIGRALVPWMISKGAKNVIMLGRSAKTNDKVRKILEQYEGAGVNVRAIPCDVGSRAELTRATQAFADLPKVRGVVHSVMALRDSIFANMEFEDWEKVASPKVQGAWNLHELYPGLDFFVALSGMTGIVGNISQSVYTGTSTFLEAFVDYRLNQGLPAAVIHLPPVEDIGLVAELNIGDRVRKSIGGILSGPQVLALVEGAIVGPISGLTAAGKSLTWSLASASDVPVFPWEQFEPLSVMRRQRTVSQRRSLANGSAEGTQDPASLDPSELLMETLTNRVAAVTAMDRDEITPTRSLMDYGLDSLISLDLRNWVRRNFDIDMSVEDINTSKDLKSIRDHIMANRKRA
ncbi:putative polyketide synthase [Nemania abortiva]|nr:putative polyketide synthase [Nemania abortiva]